MTSLQLHLDGIGKEFNRRSVFRDISVRLSGSVPSLAITGRNGSGKSTLVKIMAGVLSPTRGSVRYEEHGKVLEDHAVKHRIGFVAPYLQLYDEFSALENLQLLSRMRSTDLHGLREMQGLLEQFNLWHRRSDAVRTYSSGMKQRLKYVFALLHRPDVLILDEPGSNLDAEGLEGVENVVRRQKEAGLLVIATNDAHEAAWCSERIHLG